MSASDGCEPAERQWPVYVMAGGRSRRFGTDKARHIVDGVPLIRTLANIVGPDAKEVVVCADRRGKYDDLGLVTIGDRRPGLGPIAGLERALHHNASQPAPAEWIFVTACDWWGIRREWVQGLAAHRSDAVDGVVYDGERVEPLFGFYRRSMGDVVERAISEGALAMHELLDRVRTCRVTPPLAWRHVRNVNGPGDLDRPPRDRDVGGATGL